MPKRIMTVDDSATIRTMLNLTLTSAGYEVVEACDGEEALAMLAAGSVDLLVAGASGWIVKPFKPEQLLGVVRMVWSEKSRREIGRHIYCESVWL